MLSRACKPDQFSQFIHLHDLMARLGEGNGKVNQSGRKELRMIYVIGEEKCKCERVRERGLNDAGRKKCHYSCVTSIVTVTLLYGSILNDTL